MHSLLTVVFVVFAAAALVWDARTQRLPNRLTVSGLFVALALRSVGGVAPLLDGLAGAGIALGVSFPLFVIGAVGGGDAKLLAALGAFTGVDLLWPALIASMVLGGVLGIVASVRGGVIIPALLSTRRFATYLLTGGRRGERPSPASPGALKVPYGVAISLGFLAAWFLPLREWVRL
ncbi:MAG: prepilin peptidase [Gemmatimonadetes bacterium]|nr:prepilin peptidase [Gemmatimonadota bacterium]